MADPTVANNVRAHLSSSHGADAGACESENALAYLHDQAHDREYAAKYAADAARKSTVTPHSAATAAAHYAEAVKVAVAADRATYRNFRERMGQ